MTAVAVAVVLVICSWFATYGGWAFLEAESFGAFYDAQARSLLKGRVDVPPDAIGNEALVRDGKAYGYFGPTPALPRILLNTLVPRMYGRWSRLSALAACLVNLVVAWLFLQWIRQEHYPGQPRGGRTTLAHGLFLLVAGLGTTNVFLLSRSYVYHEAILWGSALALLCCFFLFRYWSSRRRIDLALAMLFCYLTLFARISSGAGATAAMALTLAAGLWARVRGGAGHPPLPRAFGRRLRHGGRAARLHPAEHDRRGDSRGAAGARSQVFELDRRDLVLLGAFLAFLAASYMGWNYAKFRTLLDAQPYRFHVQYTPQRLAGIDGTLVHPENAVFNIRQYFLRPNIRFRSSFPWVYCQEPAGLDRAGVKLDWVEPFASVTAATPALVLLALLGVRRLGRRGGAGLTGLRIVVPASFLSGASLLVFAALSQRYLHDFYPFLIIAGAVGLHELAAWRSERWKSAAVTALLLAAAFSVWANTAFAFTYQSDIVWGFPVEHKKVLWQIKHRVDDLFRAAPLRPIHVHDVSEAPAEPAPGQLLVIGNREATYWFDGREWVHVGGAEAGRYLLRVRFPERLAHTLEPLLVTGGPQGCEAVYVEQFPPNALALGYQHGAGGRFGGAPIHVQPGKEYSLEVHLDRLNRRVTLKLDGAEILRHGAALFPWKEESVGIGVNRLGCGGAEKFSGTIERAP